MMTVPIVTDCTHTNLALLNLALSGSQAISGHRRVLFCRKWDGNGL